MASSLATPCSIRCVHQSDGPAAVLAIGTSSPANCVSHEEYPDYYFRVTKSEHLAQHKETFKIICRLTGMENHFFYHSEELLKYLKMTVKLKMILMFQSRRLGMGRPVRRREDRLPRGDSAATIPACCRGPPVIFQGRARHVHGLRRQANPQHRPLAAGNYQTDFIPYVGSGTEIYR